MVLTQLDPSQSRLLGALTIAISQHLGADTMLVEEDNGMRELRMARVDQVVLLIIPPTALGRAASTSIASTWRILPTSTA